MFMIQDPGQHVLAARMLGYTEAQAGSLSVSLVSDAGCPNMSGNCATQMRSAFEIADPSESAIVYDGTLRVLELSESYVAQTQAVVVTDVWDNCEVPSTYHVSVARLAP